MPATTAGLAPAVVFVSVSTRVRLPPGHRRRTAASGRPGRCAGRRDRYAIVEVSPGFPEDVPDDFAWLTLAQLTTLLAHGNYLNMELRTLAACALTLQ
ncbi:NDP-hexose 2,3-dehydratase family protein [Streptomyces phaeochromogenes]|uniref:NDP-hexose 2,3-dehydratase family protein n=1 Tax=Streptomyces phaeochromogenes TaxID=1923 RepID=UPI0037124C7E